MSSIRCSRLLAVLAVVALVTAGAAMAVTVENEEVPSEGEVGERVSATFTLTELYQDPSYQEWAVGGDTELRNVTWTIEFYDLGGSEIRQVEVDDQEINSSLTSFSQGDGVSEIVVEVNGNVPPIEEGEFAYPEREQFVVAELTQEREGGSGGTINTWRAHHYTSDTSEARDALDSAQSGIDEVQGTGAEIAGASDDLDQAKEAYRSGNFDLAVDLAGDAESVADRALEARSALDEAQSVVEGARADGADVTEAEGTLEDAEGAYQSGDFQRAMDLANDSVTMANEAGQSGGGGGNTLLLVGAAVVVLVLVAVGVFYWRNQDDDQGTRLQ